MRSYSTTADPRIKGQDNIMVCPRSHPYQCPYATGTPVCGRTPDDCVVPNQGIPFSTANGNSLGLVPVAHPTESETYGWCGGTTNRHLPAHMTWTRECQSTMPDIEWYSLKHRVGNPLSQMMS
jgi:hypothetical protein